MTVSGFNLAMNRRNYIFPEGMSVETQDQVNVLEELGCDYAQGSFFNKAITIETFEVRYLKE